MRGAPNPGLAVAKCTCVSLWGSLFSRRAARGHGTAATPSKPVAEPLQTLLFLNALVMLIAEHPVRKHRGASRLKCSLAEAVLLDTAKPNDPRGNCYHEMPAERQGIRLGTFPPLGCAGAAGSLIFPLAFWVIFDRDTFVSNRSKDHGGGGPWGVLGPQVP